MKEQPDFNESKNNLRRKISVKTTGELKNLELTDEQYVRLITLLKIGLRVVGFDDKDRPNIPLIDIDQYVSSYAKQFNAEHLVELSEELGGVYFCKETLSQSLHVLIQLYGDRFILQDLSHKLATRDLLKSAGGKSTKPINAAFKKFEAYYDKEFKKNGLQNLIIADKKTAPPSL